MTQRVQHYAPTLHPAHAARIGPVLTQTLEFFRSPTMASGLSFALLPTLNMHTAKPHGFGSLSALARAIHRRRGDKGLQLKPATVQFQDRVRPVVEVLATLPDEGGVCRIGFAWIAGADFTTGPLALQRALDAQVPNARVGG